MRKKTASKGTQDIPLEFAKQLTSIVNAEWEKSIHQFTPVTQDLLRYWFDSTFCDNRRINFHAGQKQAILNTIYCHEILKVRSVMEMYQRASEGLLDDNIRQMIQSDKYAHPKYCVKMATGTGKTWCMNALFLWQYLNAKYSRGDQECTYTKNFLFVAPGLIVYERLLDSFLGKENSEGVRDFDSSDLKQNEAVFIPEKYRDAVYSFVQNSVVRKEEIGRKPTGEGIIAITNWHALNEEDDEDEEDSGSDEPKDILKDLLPIIPGTTQGHTLESLDQRYFQGGILEQLKKLPSLCVFNDEAHHIHENKTAGEITEVEWQRAMNKLSADKGDQFLQIDFSATPYDVAGTGQRRMKHYFPHIVVNYTLGEAIQGGLVKMIAIDKRKEIASIPNADLDFSSVREGKKVKSLSEGQRLMLRAGLKKLRILEEEFTKIHPDKHPKMLVVCEDTNVSPYVVQFLQQEGLEDKDIMQIDSDQKGRVSEKEWKGIKQKLFNIDKRESPKVVVSVLMLREGFDVSNVCVIVPLRSSEAPILLEQVIGRGLRLMWREPQYNEIKAEMRELVLEKKGTPKACYDILYIVEHPAFLQFYEDLDKSMAYEDEGEERESVLGDMISVGLKEDYERYDFFIPHIIREQEETLVTRPISVSGFDPFPWSLEQLQRKIGEQSGEIMVSEEIIAKTHFGEYKVDGQIFSAKSYNDYLQKIISSVTKSISLSTRHKGKRQFPILQICHTSLAAFVDEYIRTKLFGKPFDPLYGNNWRVLVVGNHIIEHMVKQISKVIYDYFRQNMETEEAVVKKYYFSEITSMQMRENFSLDVQKSIYQRTAYPSNKGMYEKDFMCYADEDGEVERLIKIDPNYHAFAGLHYVRTDGHFGTYYPDFILKIGSDIFLLETKAQKDLSQEDVKQKEKGALDWVQKINRLQPDDRMHAEWHYVILGDKDFYRLKEQNASIRDMARLYSLTPEKMDGRLL